MKNAVVAIIGVLILGAWMPGASLSARQVGVAGDAPAVTPAEIQRMFDAYALVQAQDQLKLGDEQYSRFLSRFKSLQEIRRRAQTERVRLVQELRRLAADVKSDESLLRDRIKALQDLDVRTAADVRRAEDAVDQVLDVRQQAQFRAFEELMERRKIELVTRARQNNRANARGLRGQ